MLILKVQYDIAYN